MRKQFSGGEFSDPIEEFEKYKTHTFIAPMLDDMQKILMGWVESGGVGISSSVQSALFDNMRERDLQTLKDMLDAAGSVDAKRGFKARTPWLFKGNPPRHLIDCRMCAGCWVSLAVAVACGDWLLFPLVYGASYFLATQER